MTLKDYSQCYQCNTKLKNVRVPRTSAKLCGECKGDGQSDNSGIKKLHQQLKAKNLKPSEDEMFFEDEPSAIKEQDYGRYISKPTEHISTNTSALVDMMSPSTSHHHYKRGSATNGTRYSYRKGEVE
jgi:hypothetical protein